MNPVRYRRENRGNQMKSQKLQKIGRNQKFGEEVFAENFVAYERFLNEGDIRNPSEYFRKKKL